jgi:pimeloyl-ACP methyl ester carboxylesterase
MRTFLLVPITIALLAPTLAAQQRPGSERPIGRYEIVDCFAPLRAWAKAHGVECGWLTIPELRSRPDGPTVRLAVARLRASNPTAPPIVYLHGGPGGAGALGPATAGRFTTLSAGLRDVVYYDQRAVGLSEPKLCAGIPGETGDTARTQERWNADARACVASIRAQGRDPVAYTTVVQADDLRELRIALGYRQWDLYGVSYGGRLAFEAMRRDPAGIRAVVVNSPAIPVIPSLTEDPISVQKALQRLFDRCAEQADCRATFPALEQDFRAVYDSLSANPIVLDRARGATRIDGHQFLRAVRCELSNHRKAPRLPLAIRELHRGNRVHAATVLANDCLNDPPGGRQQVNVKNYLINCGDGHGTAYWEARRAVQARVEPMWLVFEEGGDECDFWQRRLADSADLSPVKSDIPTLLITGELDERTPTDHARRGAAGLSRKYLYEIPGEAHGTPAAGCQAELIRQFLANPVREPDASCLAAMPKIAFAMTSLSITNLTLSITTDPANSRFAGTWEAELPNMPRPFTVELRTEGSKVAGTWNPNRLEILDGTITGDTLRFKVKSPDGTRTISFAGTLRDNELTFIRTTDAPARAGQQGQGIFGVAGVPGFTMTRTP